LKINSNYNSNYNATTSTATQQIAQTGEPIPQIEHAESNLLMVDI
jgi:hypothetical protein